MNPFRRTLLRVAVAVLIVAALAWVLFRVVVAPDDRREATPPRPPPQATVSVDAGPPQPEQVRAHVVRITGEAQRLAADGAWVPVEEGASLDDSDRIRTLRGGSVELQVGDADSVLIIPETTEVDLGELTRAEHNFKIGRGRITVDYQEKQGRVLRVEGESGAVAQTSGARFTVLSTGTSIAVATERGEVDLTSAGASVKVSAGQQSVALEGAAPAPAEAIPVNVLLRVARSSGPQDVCVAIAGTVRPGSSVDADGEPVEVDRQGRFKLSVPRRPGLARVRIRAREPSGNVAEREFPCREKPVAEEVDFQWDSE